MGSEAVFVILSSLTFVQVEMFVVCMLVRYYAAMSYSDALVGKVLAKLKANGFDKNTIVVLFGDHGWQLVSA